MSEIKPFSANIGIGDELELEDPIIPIKPIEIPIELEEEELADENGLADEEILTQEVPNDAKKDI